MKKNVFKLLIFLLLAFLASLVGARFFGLGSLPMVIAVVLAVAALLWFTRKIFVQSWIAVGLLVLGLSFIPTARITQHLGTPPEPLNNLITTVLFWIPTVALLVAAKLLYSALVLRAGARSGAEAADALPTQRAVLVRVAVILCVLLAAKTLLNLYWLTVWDNSDDSIGYLYLAMPALACMVSGVIFFLLLPGWTKLAGWAPLLLIPLMIGLSTVAQRVDYRQLTQARAARVTQAVETYRARKGQYPPSLRALVPGYLLSLPQPVVLYGQSWCYDVGADFYRLGYVEREHWSAPILVVRTFKTSGALPDFPPACAAELAGLIKDRPSFWTVSEVGP